MTKRFQRGRILVVAFEGWNDAGEAATNAVRMVRDALPLVPGEPAQLVFDLLPLSMVFKAGHRIRLVLTFAAGRLTPRLDPAPRVSVYRDRVHASAIILPLIE